MNRPCLAVVRWGCGFFIAFRCLAALAGDANEMSVVGAQEDPAYQAILGDVDGEIDSLRSRYHEEQAKADTHFRPARRGHRKDCTHHQPKDPACQIGFPPHQSRRRAGPCIVADF